MTHVIYSKGGYTHSPLSNISQNLINVGGIIVLFQAKVNNAPTDVANFHDIYPGVSGKAR